MAALSYVAENPANADAIYLGGALEHLVWVLREDECQHATKKHAATTLALLSTSSQVIGC